MKYKIISIHPGIDEFCYYKSKADAESFLTPCFVERKIGSKGANCAVLLSSKGADVDYFTVGNGAYDCDSLMKSERIKIFRTLTKSAERKNIKLIYPENDINGMIEKNGKMDPLSEEEKRNFFSSILTDKEKSDEKFSTYVFTGSLPPGVEKEEYLRCISRLSSLGEYVVLDGRGSLISAQNENFAALIKPNKDEFCEMAAFTPVLKGFQPPTEKSANFYTDYLESSLKYVEKYGSEVLLTLGEAGLIYASCDEHFIKKAVPKKLSYPAGAGDRLLSSFLYYKRSLGADTSSALDTAMNDAVGETDNRENL